MCPIHYYLPPGPLKEVMSHLNAASLQTVANTTDPPLLQPEDVPLHHYLPPEPVREVTCLLNAASFQAVANVYSTRVTVVSTDGFQYQIMPYSSSVSTTQLHLGHLHGGKFVTLHSKVS